MIKPKNLEEAHEYLDGLVEYYNQADKTAHRFARQHFSRLLHHLFEAKIQAFAAANEVELGDGKKPLYLI